MLTLFSCRQDVQIAPTLPDETVSAVQSFTSTAASAEEINSIKEWYESIPVTKGLNCSAVTHHPRWDKSKKGGDRVEFEIFENVNKIPVPRLPAANAKKGAKRFVTKEINGNGNGNANGNNRKGAIVSYIPFNSFNGNMDDLTTSTFRYMQFDGIIIFHEVSGCYMDSYLIDKGVVMKKLKLTTQGLGERCGYEIVQDWFQTTTNSMGVVSDPVFLGSNILASVDCNLNISNNITSYDLTMANSTFNGGNPTGDATYGDYLSGYTITPIIRICPVSFQFQTFVDPTGQATRLEAGIRNEGVSFTVPGSPNPMSFGFNHVTFSLPQFAPNFQQGISTNQATATTTAAFNLALNQVQQQISMTGSTPNNIPLNDYFWSRVNVNISNSLGLPQTSTFIQLGSGPKTYYSGFGGTQTVVYRVPTSSNGC